MHHLELKLVLGNEEAVLPFWGPSNKDLQEELLTIRMRIPLKITSTYLYCHLFPWGLNNISFNCANIICCAAISKSYFREEYPNPNICSLKYRSKKEKKKWPRYRPFFTWFNPNGLKFIGTIHKSKKFWVLKTWKPQMVLLAQTSFHDYILSEKSPKSIDNTDLSQTLQNVSKNDWIKKKNTAIISWCFIMKCKMICIVQ